MRHWSLIIVLLAMMAAFTFAPAPVAADDNTGEILIGAAAIGALVWYLSDHPEEAEDLFDKAAPVAIDYLFKAMDTARDDPEVMDRLFSGDYEGALQVAWPIIKVSLKNSATEGLSDPLIDDTVAVYVHKLINEQWPQLGAAIARPGGDGLWWRYDRWMLDHGYPRGASLLEWPTKDHIEELRPLVTPAFIEEWAAAETYLAASIHASVDDALPISTKPEGLDTGGDW